jgi:hypothetical protein
VFSLSSAASLKEVKRYFGEFCNKVKGTGASTPPTSKGSTPSLARQGQRLACLARRCRALACTPQMLKQGMHLVGSVYNFCTPHQSLRLRLYLDEHRHRWVKRTPAMAAGRTNPWQAKDWSVMELLSFKVAPPPYEPPKSKRRGRAHRDLKSLAA